MPTTYENHWILTKGTDGETMATYWLQNRPVDSFCHSGATDTMAQAGALLKSVLTYK